MDHNETFRFRRLVNRDLTLQNNQKVSRLFTCLLYHLFWLQNLGLYLSANFFNLWCFYFFPLGICLLNELAKISSQINRQILPVLIEPRLVVLASSKHLKNLQQLSLLLLSQRLSNVLVSWLHRILFFDCAVNPLLKWSQHVIVYYVIWRQQLYLFIC